MPPIFWRSNKIVRCSPAKALEATLRVGHRTRDPARGERVEHTAQQAAVEWLRPAPIAAVGVDAAAEGDVMLGQRIGEQRQLIGRRGQVCIGEEDEFALRVEHSGLHGRAFASMRPAQQPQLSRTIRRGPPGDRRRSRPSRRCCRRRRPEPPRCPCPLPDGRPRAPDLAASGSRRAHRAPTRSGPPRCRQAERG